MKQGIGTVVLWMLVSVVPASGQIVQIMDSTGDGGGNPLGFPNDIAVDDVGVLYASGFVSDNVFMVMPDGSITEIIDSSGDGLGNLFWEPKALARTSHQCLLRRPIRRTLQCFSQFALLNALQVRLRRSNHEKPSRARRLGRLATKLVRSTG